MTFVYLIYPPPLILESPFDVGDRDSHYSLHSYPPISEALIGSYTSHHERSCTGSSFSDYFGDLCLNWSSHWVYNIGSNPVAFDQENNPSVVWTIRSYSSDSFGYAPWSPTPPNSLRSWILYSPNRMKRTRDSSYTLQASFAFPSIQV